MGFCGGLFIRYSLLEPEGFGVEGDGGIGDGRNCFGPSEDIDNVDWEGNVFEAGVGFFAQDFGLVGIYRDDFVARALEVGGDFIGRPARIRRETDDSDGFGSA